MLYFNSNLGATLIEVGDEQAHVGQMCCSDSLGGPLQGFRRHIERHQRTLGISGSDGLRLRTDTTRHFQDTSTRPKDGVMMDQFPHRSRLVFQALRFPGGIAMDVRFRWFQKCSVARDANE